MMGILLQNINQLNVAIQNINRRSLQNIDKLNGTMQIMHKSLVSNDLSIAALQKAINDTAGLFQTKGKLIFISNILKCRVHSEKRWGFHKGAFVSGSDYISLHSKFLIRTRWGRISQIELYLTPTLIILGLWHGYKNDQQKNFYRTDRSRIW